MSYFYGEPLLTPVGDETFRLEASIVFYHGDPAEKTLVMVPKGFLTDGASIPRIFWPFLSPWGSYSRAAIIHDFLCVHRTYTLKGVPNTPLSRAECDAILLDAMETLKVPVVTRRVIYAAVRAYAITTGIK